MTSANLSPALLEAYRTLGHWSETSKRLFKRGPLTWLKAKSHPWEATVRDWMVEYRHIERTRSAMTPLMLTGETSSEFLERLFFRLRFDGTLSAGECDAFSSALRTDAPLAAPSDPAAQSTIAKCLLEFGRLRPGRNTISVLSRWPTYVRTVSELVESPLETPWPELTSETASGDEFEYHLALHRQRSSLQDPPYDRGLYEAAKAFPTLERAYDAWKNQANLSEGAQAFVALYPDMRLRIQRGY